MTRTVRWPQRGRLLTVAVVLAGGVTSISAQTAANSQPTRVVVIGCLKEAPASSKDSKIATLTITDFRGGPSPTFQLDAGDRRLGPHTDQMIEITGIVVRAPNAPDRIPSRLEVHAVTVLSPTCWPSQDRVKTGFH